MSERTACPRDTDWCDGRICREHGIECPNADPLLEKVGEYYGFPVYAVTGLRNDLLKADFDGEKVAVLLSRMDPPEKERVL